MGCGCSKSPSKGVDGHYCLVNIIKIIDKITFSFLTVFSTLFVLLYFIYLAVFQKVIKFDLVIFVQR